MGTALVLYQPQQQHVLRNEAGHFLPGTQPGPGRDSLYSEEKVQTICDNLVKGATPEMAAEAAGIHRDTFYHWCDTRDGFSDRVMRARAQVHVDMSNIVTSAAKGEVTVRQAEPAIEYLKRRDRAAWGDVLDVRKLDVAQLMALLQQQAENGSHGQQEAIEDGFDAL